jgi:crotonobetainyl-CoA:carnitine CoA-transferase CaiB-like acyl-CoA transferase
MPGPLHGYTVLELGEGIPAGYCGRLLAGFGATVTKVEPPGGDRSRHARVVPGASAPDPERAPLFLYLGMGKRSLVADLDDPGDAARVRRLAARADVLLAGRPSAAMERLGLGYDAFGAENPALVYTSLTPFGDWGPYRDWRAENINALALGGQMGLTGEPDREPLCTGGEQAWYQLGLHGFAATCFALVARSESGLGQQVDVSAVECMAGALEGWGPGAHFSGLATPRTGRIRFAFMGVYPCRDGYAGLFCTPGQVPIFAQLAGRPDFLADPRMQSVLAMVMANEELLPIARGFMAAHTKEEILEMGRSTGMTVAPVRTVEDVAASAQLAARGFFVELPVAGGGTVRVPGPPFRMGATPWQSRPAPRLGELSQAEAERLLSGERPPVVPRPVTEPPPKLNPPPQSAITGQGERIEPRTDRSALGIFAGIRVLDFTAYWAGPYATKWLADFGAEVVKVEPVNRLDLVRTVSNDYSHPRPYDVGAYFNNYARGKQSLAVDPSHPRGREAILALLPKFDVVIENFKAGRMAAIGLGYDVLTGVRPDIIMISISGYGQDGPDAGLAGVGTNMEQLSGIASLNVYSDDPHPANTGIAYGDPNAGCLAAAAVAMALMHRNATGEGQYVDISGLETLDSMIGEQFAALSLGLTPAPKGNRHPDMAPHGCYPCQGEDKWVTLAVRTDDEWRALCRTIERADLEATYPTLADRLANELDIDAAIMGWTLLRTDYDAARELQAAGIAATPVLGTRELLDDPHLRLRGYFETVDDRDMGPWPHDGIAWRLGRTPGSIRAPAPRLGQHTRAVLARLLGWTLEQIEELYANGAAGDAPGQR